MVTKKIGAPDRGHTSVRRAFILNEGALSKLKLTPHDINVISVVARNRSLDEKKLLQLVRESRPSRNAMDIVNIILKINQKLSSDPSGDEGGQIKRAIANNYLIWASHLEHPVMKRAGGSKKSSDGERPKKSKKASGRS